METREKRMKGYFGDDALGLYEMSSGSGSPKLQDECIQSQKQGIIYDAVVLDAKLHIPHDCTLPGASW